MLGPVPRHSRFYLAFTVGVLVFCLGWFLGVRPELALLAGANSLFLLYLLLMAVLVRDLDPDALRRQAEQDDEGTALILVLALVAVAGGLTAIVVVLNSAGTSVPVRTAALACLPLGWITIHVMAAFHYAHLHYQSQTAGMDFPGKEEPGIWDFLYSSFTIGMTAQVSDVAVTTAAMRRSVLFHGVVSFFYNTGILALAVNAVVTAGL